jgi:transposase, IS5 family
VVGQPPKATRLMVELLYLKHTYSLSDEALLERWVENPYWQAFCGMEYFQHEPPIHPSSLTYASGDPRVLGLQFRGRDF